MLAIRKPETQVDIWDESNWKEIKKMFAPEATDKEFAIFVGMGRATGLNPYLKELWMVKYDKSKPAQIFIGRDGYRVSAQRNPSYDYHTSDAVYSNDKFTLKNGMPEHEYGFPDRGTLLGAYAIAARKGASRPSYVYVPLVEYNQNHSLWVAGKGGKQSTMIKKVAEAQVVRMCWQEIYGGSYHEYEQWREARTPQQSTTRGIDALEQKLGLASAAIIEGETVEQETDPILVEHMQWNIDNAGDMDDLEFLKERIAEFSKAARDTLRPLYNAKKKELCHATDNTKAEA